jgi:hypothetical protein
MTGLHNSTTPSCPPVASMALSLRTAALVASAWCPSRTTGG